MSEAGPQPDMTVPYVVALRRGTKRRILISLKRDQHEYGIGHFTEQAGLVYLSTKPRGFWDAQDEAKIRAECEKLLSEKPKTEKLLGTIELWLILRKGRIISISYNGTVDGQIAAWNPELGLRFTEDAHPAFRKDRQFLAQACLDLPQGIGGIFSRDLDE